jgi:hypothetical protein
LAIGSVTSIGAVGIGGTASSLSDLADTGGRTGRRLESLCACHGKFHRHGVFQLVHRRGCPHHAQGDRHHQGGNVVTLAMSGIANAYMDTQIKLPHSYFLPHDDITGESDAAANC